jgi:hypothetical protein
MAFLLLLLEPLLSVHVVLVILCPKILVCNCLDANTPSCNCSKHFVAGVAEFTRYQMIWMVQPLTMLMKSPHTHNNFVGWRVATVDWFDQTATMYFV